MKRISLFVLSAVTLAMAASLMIALVGANASPELSPDHVGLVVAYTPDQSITIVNKDGAEFTFTIAPDVKILPANLADQLGVGSYVTIISPNNPGNDGDVATGIVIHPQAPNGFTQPNPTETALPSETATAIATDTATETATVTETVTETETATPTEIGTEEVPTETATATATGTAAANPQAAAQSFIEWLAALFNQYLGSNG